MPTPTYDLIASNVLSSSASSVTFSSIPATYRDLVLVVTATTNQNNNSGIQFNNDTGTNYFGVIAEANGTTASSSSYNDGGFIYNGYNYNNVGLTQSVFILQVFDYAQTNKHKSVLVRTNKADTSVSMTAGRWANTAAINTIGIFPGALTWSSGSTFYLYGIVS